MFDAKNWNMVHANRWKLFIIEASGTCKASLNCLMSFGYHAILSFEEPHVLIPVWATHRQNILFRFLLLSFSTLHASIF